MVPRKSSGWQSELRELPVMAAIEIKAKRASWNNEIGRDLDKLLQRMEVDPIQQGYIVVLFDAEKYPMAWQDVRTKIMVLRDKCPRNHDISIYFAPWSRIGVQPQWIDINHL